MDIATMTEISKGRDWI